MSPRAMADESTSDGSAAREPRGAALVCEIDDYDLQGFCAVAARHDGSRYGYVVTPNVDHLLRLYDDPEFRGLYRAASYVLLDSRVIALTLRLVRHQRLRVCTGSDLTAALFDQVVAPADRIVLVGGTADQARAVAERYGLTNLRHHEPPMGFITNAAATEACLRFVEQAAPFRFCFLAVGSPQQELIAQRLRTRGAATGLALCVGAALNFITGAERRAPPWMRRRALEWLYRLSNDPARLARRYLIRGPRIFALLLANRLALRSRRADAAHLSRASGGPSESAP